MSGRRRTWVLLTGALLLLLLAFNFLNFRVAQSSTRVEHTLSTYRTGQTLPQNMTSGFRLHYRVDGEGRLARALAEALKAALETKAPVGAATQVAPGAQLNAAPLLLVEIAPERLWTPFFGRATVTAQLFFAYDGDAPWPLDEAMVFKVSPAVKADGTFTLTDSSWGLLSKAAYDEHLAQALADDIVVALQDDVFRRPHDHNTESTLR